MTSEIIRVCARDKLDELNFEFPEVSISAITHKTLHLQFYTLDAKSVKNKDERRSSSIEHDVCASGAFTIHIVFAKGKIQITKIQ